MTTKAKCIIYFDKEGKMKRYFFIAIIIALMLMCSCTDQERITPDEIEFLIKQYRQIDGFMVSNYHCLSTTWDEGAIFFYPDYYNSHHHVEVDYEVYRLYFPVKDEAFDEWQEVESFVRSTYTADTADNLLREQTTLINHNGQTWTMDWSGSDTFLSNEFSYEVTEEFPDSAAVVCKIESEPHNSDEIGDDFTLTITFFMKRTEDGWRIDNAVKEVIDR